MIIKEWPVAVNTKFYKGTTKPEDNVITTEYTSGRKIAILANTRFVFDIECDLSVNATERNAFWKWFTEQLGGCAGVFHCAALRRTATSTEYFRFKGTPSESEGQKFRKLSFKIEEIY